MIECVAFVRVASLPIIDLDSGPGAPGGSQNSEFVCVYVLPQTIGQMVMVGPTSLK